MTMHEHLLDEISLPDRYERLVGKVGAEVARIIIPPKSRMTYQAVTLLARDAITRDEGMIVPVFAGTGAGKTTFVENIGHWVPADFTTTLTYVGELTYDGLAAAVEEFKRDLPENNRKIIPINIDHRESNPPTDAELSAIKRFLRTKGGGAPSIVFWPEIDKSLAEQFAKVRTH